MFGEHVMIENNTNSCNNSRNTVHHHHHIKRKWCENKSKKNNNANITSCRNGALSWIASPFAAITSTSNNIIINNNYSKKHLPINDDVVVHKLLEPPVMMSRSPIASVMPSTAPLQRRSTRIQRRWYQYNSNNDSNPNTEENDFHHNMPLFDRSELVLGDLIGKGAFCVVHELQDVHLNHHNKLTSSLSSSWWLDKDGRCHHQQQDRAREWIRQTCQYDDGTHNPRYVIKHLRPGLAIDRSYKVHAHAAMDLVTEFEILSRLSHPNIVQLRGGAVMDTSMAVEKDDYFLILDRVEETLSDRIMFWKKSVPSSSSLCQIQQRPPTKKRSSTIVHPCYVEKLRLACDIASALSYVHEHNLVFRDLKPDNCGIGAHGRMKLFDFGLCRELPKQITSSSSRGKDPVFRMSGVGTRRYMSPEMILGTGYNQKVDCYSWSMVFYEMLSLQKPYASYNREVHRILVCENEERPYPTVDIPLCARDLLQRAWAQDHDERPSMKQIYQELGPMIESAERQALSPHERSLKVVMEMAELFSVENDCASTTVSGSSSNSNNHQDVSSFFSRKSTADLTVSTASAEPSLFYSSPPISFCSGYGKD
jgi:serine/threonine protein kinase/uncharacterized Fe-S cluster protein YjdI